MRKPLTIALLPRKTPVQRRSTASVDAILQATIQVLLTAGRAKLTTTRVAARAGVSVGTLYQYFPNKSSLLQALLRQHLDGVAEAVEAACRAQQGVSLATMADVITQAFVQAKFRNIATGIALYAVSDDVDGKSIAQQMHDRAQVAIAALLRTAPDRVVDDPESVARVLLGAMAGVSRVMLERGLQPTTLATLEQELTVLVRSYLLASGVERASDETPRGPTKAC